MHRHGHFELSTLDAVRYDAESNDTQGNSNAQVALGHVIPS